MGILQYDTQRLPQIRFFDLVNIDAVVTDLTILNIIETVDQVRDRGLTGAGGAYKCDLLTGRLVFFIGVYGWCILFLPVCWCKCSIG